MLSLFVWPLSGFGQNAAEKMEEADQLFQIGRYTEALKQYENLLFEDRVFSSAMLLKMAYIHEGLDEPIDALFYLEQYYKQSREQAVVEKISSLATTYELRGFENTDAGLILRWYDRYFRELSFLFLGMATLFLALLIYRFKKFQERPMVLFLMANLCLLLSITAIQRFGLRQYGMLKADTVLLMSGPAAGSKLVEQVGPGHKVPVLGTQDVWTRIKWKDQEVYVKSDFLRQI